MKKRNIYILIVMSLIILGVFTLGLIFFKREVLYYSIRTRAYFVYILMYPLFKLIPIFFNMQLQDLHWNPMFIGVLAPIFFLCLSLFFSAVCFIKLSELKYVEDREKLELLYVIIILILFIFIIWIILGLVGPFFKAMLR